MRQFVVLFERTRIVEGTEAGHIEADLRFGSNPGLTWCVRLTLIC